MAGLTCLKYSSTVVLDVLEHPELDAIGETVATKLVYSPDPWACGLRVRQLTVTVH